MANNKKTPSNTVIPKIQDAELLTAWQDRTKGFLERARQATDKDRPMDAKNWATAAGIGTDKLLVLGGRPTQIIQGINTVRHELPQLIGRLVQVAKLTEVKNKALGDAKPEPSSK